MSAVEKYNVYLRYQPGKDMLFQLHFHEHKDVNFEIETINTLEAIPVASMKLDILQRETQKDQHQQFCQTISDEISEVKQTSTIGFQHADELGTQEGLVLRGARINVNRDYDYTEK